jgi:23S rRNA pseudouridine1911/1915/1917 synthase
LAEPGRLYLVLARLAGMPRADVQRAIAGGSVSVDGKPASKSSRLKGGEMLLMELPEAPPPQRGTEVPVRFEDQDLAVVAKPAGIPTHPTKSRLGGSMVNALLGSGMKLAQAEDPLRPGIVHRLDSGTSGLIVVAKSDRAYAALRKMMKAHEVRRTYLALAVGSIRAAGFEVEAPLGRRGSKIVVDRAAGKPARTLFEVIERHRSTTLVRATPVTGRTHQIRVHLSSVGHPIVGDKAYGGAGELSRSLGLSRPFLHSSDISFTHPFSGETIHVEEQLPDELEEALTRARSEGLP